MQEDECSISDCVDVVLVEILSRRMFTADVMMALHRLLCPLWLCCQCVEC